MFWSAALISNSANWMQVVTVQFIMFDLTGSNTWVGAAGFTMLIPAMLLTPIAGVVADRVPRRLVLLCTLSLQSVVAVVYLMLWVSDALTPWWIIVLNLVLGCSSGIQIANWQSLVPLLVPRDTLLAAIRLNSTQFTASRAIGPMVGAALLGTVGVAAVFLGNVVTFFFMLIAVISVRPRAAPPPASERLAEVMRSGFAYVLARRALLMSVATAFVIGFFGQSLVQIAAGFAVDSLGVGSLGLAGLVAAFGVGAIMASGGIITVGDYVARSKMVVGGLTLYVAGPLLLATTTIYTVGLLGYFVIGAAHVTVAIGLNTSVQIQVDEAIRGRVISIYLLGIFSGMPLGALVGGALGDVIGLRPVFTIYGLGLAAYVLLAFTRLDRMRLLDVDHDTLAHPPVLPVDSAGDRSSSR